MPTKIMPLSPRAMLLALGVLSENKDMLKPDGNRILFNISCLLAAGSGLNASIALSHIMARNL